MRLACPINVEMQVIRLKHRVIFPRGFDDYEWADIEAKGWLEGVQVLWEDGELILSVFDEVRLPQVIRVDIERLGYFAAKEILVVPSVTREQIELAVERMAERNFSDV